MSDPMKPQRRHTPIPSQKPAPDVKVVIPPVPANSWYAQAFTEGSPLPVSAFHAANKGHVVFAARPIPVRQAELDGLPGQAPVTSQFLDLGKDLVYGMAYLHTSALSTEHRWRGRVAHLLDVTQGRVQAPESIRKAAAARAEMIANDEKKVKGKERKKSMSSSAVPLPSPNDAASASASSPSPSPGAGPDPLMNLDRTEPTIYQHPFFDTVVGYRVFINDELIPDHYPGVKSLPQCTSTLDTPDAVNLWNCVPCVLMGYLNHVSLETIDMYRTLSLSFVEHLLRIKFPVLSAGGGGGEADKSSIRRPGTATTTTSATSTPTTTPNSATAAGKKTALDSKSLMPAVAPGTRVMELQLQVEVVYGCRAEAYYCTEFLSRGSCTLFLAETAKPALKSYEEKLRALTMAKRSSEQIVRAPSPAASFSSSSAGAAAPVRTCQYCGNLHLFRCTVCGADYCGSLMCSRRPLRGYPCGCSAHKAML